MKNILLILSFLLLAGCSAETTTGPELQTTDSPQVPELAEATDSKECSKTNPPTTIENIKTGVTLLNRCGEETNYYAYEFTDQNLILFLEFDLDKPADERNYTLKTISTTTPYEESTLREDISLQLYEAPLHIEDNTYTWFSYADAPGYSISLFMFNPETKDFNYISQLCTGYTCDKQMTIASSKNPEFLNIVESKATEEELKLLSCNLQIAVSYPSDKEERESQLNKLVKNFPDKIDCYNHDRPMVFTGYIDFENNEFIPEP